MAKPTPQPIKTLDAPAAKTPEPASQETRKVEALVLSADRLRGAEFDRVTYTCNPPTGHLLEHMLQPAYWAHVAPKLAPWTKIEVRAEDGTYYGELLVLACDRTWARMHVLRWDDLTTQDVSMSEAATLANSGYKIDFSPNARWHVIRKSDQQMMHRDAQTLGDAQHWLREHLKVVPA